MSDFTDDYSTEYLPEDFNLGQYEDYLPEDYPELYGENEYDNRWNVCEYQST